ncbi:A-kinase anchor protein 7 isoforms alpha and beta [Blyttiomyces sp. JEL0837]|nr:A-kinase anchor protein 7 isoforms alpha and beta [Blyttiomyces sp. JEL0837]
MTLSGIGTFSNGRVVWTSPKDADTAKKLRDFAADLKDSFVSRGLVSDAYNFEPHVTLMKISPPDSRSRGARLKAIPAEVYLPFTETHFGDHTCDALELCQMSSEGPDGYYPVVKSLKIPFD